MAAVSLGVFKGYNIRIPHPTLLHHQMQPGSTLLSILIFTPMKTLFLV
jgi:hypothetical protein